MGSTYFEYLSDKQLAEMVVKPSWKLLSRFFVSQGGSPNKSINELRAFLHEEAARRFVKIVQSR